jgi:hypothetical protein
VWVCVILLIILEEELDYYGLWDKFRSHSTFFLNKVLLAYSYA